MGRHAGRRKRVRGKKSEDFALSEKHNFCKYKVIFSLSRNSDKNSDWVRTDLENSARRCSLCFKS
ncbi:hypothetical protein EHQ97_12920 [Leptospira adleri]|nr:hypothetical protein EHQ97_12920 [Leptospira adleri]